MQIKNQIALAVSLMGSLSAQVSWAQAAGASAEAASLVTPGGLTQLADVTITATRTERLVDDVPATVTVIPAAVIERSGARDLKDLLRNEIDVTDRKSVV